MTDLSHDHRGSFALTALENWAVAVATAVVALIILGILPHLAG